MSHDITIRSRPTALRRVWTTGCVYAGVYVLAGLSCWIFGIHVVPRPLLLYGLAAGVVLTFSLGLYNRSIVSGLMLLGIALGPTARGLFNWAIGGAPEIGIAGLVVKGGIALVGLAFGLQIIRALRALWRGDG